MRGNSSLRKIPFLHRLFQFTPLHERQQKDNTTTTSFDVFQFTPLHERQLRRQVSPAGCDCISIHASTWEATKKALEECGLTADFNSCLYMRGNDFQAAIIRDTSLISIHASTWEATVYHYDAKLHRLFQFTPLHERQLQKYTIFSIKSTQFSTKPCFFIVTSRKAVFFSIPVQYFL